MKAATAPGTEQNLACSECILVNLAVGSRRRSPGLAREASGTCSGALVYTLGGLAGASSLKKWRADSSSVLHHRWVLLKIRKHIEECRNTGQGCGRIGPSDKDQDTLTLFPTFCTQSGVRTVDVIHEQVLLENCQDLQRDTIYVSIGFIACNNFYFLPSLSVGTLTSFPLSFTRPFDTYVDVDVIIDIGRCFNGSLSKARWPQPTTVDLGCGWAHQPLSLGSAG